MFSNSFVQSVYCIYFKALQYVLLQMSTEDVSTQAPGRLPDYLQKVPPFAQK